MRKSLATVGVFALMVGTVSACTTNEGTSGEGDDFKEHVGSIGTAEQSQGPAPDVKGAKEGGTITYLAATEFDHIDPTQTYYVDTMEIGNMFARKLNQYRVIDGNPVVVGDLATDPGKDVSGECTEWEFTLKDGVKYEDGSEIVAEDIAYGISRSFALNQGPQFWTEWLKGAEDYEGPFDGEDIAPGINVEGDKKISFELESAHCDLPYMAAMSSSAPLPRDKEPDSPKEYERKPFASGPYKFKEEWSPKKGMTLVRNDEWDAKTDPIRHQYPEQIKVSFDMEEKQATDTIINDAEKDQHSYVTSLAASKVSTIAKNEELKERTLEAPGIFVYWMGINNLKIKDPDVRKALNYAIDRVSLVQSAGGTHVAQPATTTLSPTVNGFNDYDLYGGERGDKEKAKELLKGKDIDKLTYAYRDSGDAKDIATNIQEQLKQVGIDVDLEGLPQQTAPDTLEAKDNPYDLYMKNWGADWPSGSTVLPVLYDGRQIRDEGNTNNIFYDNEEVNEQIDKITQMTDLDEANKAWGELDEKIMKEDSPQVPLYYSKHFSLHGSKVGGLYLSSVTGTVSLTNVYAK